MTYYLSQIDDLVDVKVKSWSRLYPVRRGCLIETVDLNLAFHPDYENHSKTFADVPPIVEIDRIQF
jgi:hypothetical protein